MQDAKLLLIDEERMLLKYQNFINTFYPNGEEGLSDNHKKTYNKNMKYISDTIQRINKLREQIENDNK